MRRRNPDAPTCPDQGDELLARLDGLDALAGDLEALMTAADELVAILRRPCRSGEVVCEVCTEHELTRWRWAMSRPTEVDRVHRALNAALFGRGAWRVGFLREERLLERAVFA